MNVKKSHKIEKYNNHSYRYLSEVYDKIDTAAKKYE